MEYQLIPSMNFEKQATLRLTTTMHFYLLALILFFFTSLIRLCQYCQIQFNSAWLDLDYNGSLLFANNQIFYWAYYIYEKILLILKKPNKNHKQASTAKGPNKLSGLKV